MAEKLSCKPELSADSEQLSDGWMLQELKYLDGVVKDPQRPLVAIVGGSKVSTKIPVLTSLTEKVNKIIVG